MVLTTFFHVLVDGNMFRKHPDLMVKSFPVNFTNHQPHEEMEKRVGSNPVGFGQNRPLDTNGPPKVMVALTMDTCKSTMERSWELLGATKTCGAIETYRKKKRKNVSWSLDGMVLCLRRCKCTDGTYHV